jgi:hypothetical protein
VKSYAPPTSLKGIMWTSGEVVNGEPNQSETTGLKGIMWTSGNFNSE